MSEVTVSHVTISGQDAEYPLDLFSTTSTTELKAREVSPGLVAEIEFQIEQSKALQAGRCINGAPFICYPDGQNRWRLMQGCCNHWQCPRCGHIRARQEYARITEGVKTLQSVQKAKLFFITLTCRGRDLPLTEALEGYYDWTRRLLMACSAQARRSGSFWAYVQVTERQKRQHPHSHLISTFLPADAVLTHETRRRPDGSEYSAPIYVSKWFLERNISAGLGPQCKIEPVHSPLGMAVYLSKYLFKDCITTEWPKGWKRVRYSQTWPKLPLVSSSEAFPVVKLADWQRVAALPHLVYADSRETYERALARLVTNVIFAGN